MNICMCGTQNSYRHLEECPYPYFGNDEQKQAEWRQARHERRERILNPITQEAIDLGKALGWFDIESDDEVTDE